MDFIVVGFPHAFIRDEGTVGVADLNNPSDILPTVSVEFQGLEYEATNTLSGFDLRSVVISPCTISNLIWLVEKMRLRIWARAVSSVGPSTMNISYVFKKN